MRLILVVFHVHMLVCIIAECTVIRAKVNTDILCFFPAWSSIFVHLNELKRRAHLIFLQIGTNIASFQHFRHFCTVEHAGMLQCIASTETIFITPKVLTRSVRIAIKMINFHAINCIHSNSRIDSPMHINRIKPDRQNRIIVSAAANGTNLGNLGIMPINRHQTGQVVFHR